MSWYHKKKKKKKQYEEPEEELMTMKKALHSRDNIERSTREKKEKEE